MRPSKRLLFARERLRDLVEELQPLLNAHRDEVTLLLDVPLDPDWPTYMAMDDMNVVPVFTARDADGALVGYAIFIVHRHLHYNLKCANQDVLYLKPENRKGLEAKKLIAFAEKGLKEEGVQVVSQHSKQCRDLSGLLQYMGYSQMDTIFYKRL